MRKLLNFKFLRFLALPVTFLLLCVNEASADDFLSQSHANVTWTLIGGILVMFMQAGFSMLECGLERAKNAANILMKNFSDFMIGSLVFLVLGFGIMFGNSKGGIFGTNFFFLSGIDGSTPPGQWSLTFWFFQSVFCATAATIVSGAIVGRTKFSTYLIVSFFVSAIIYPISGHWAWNSLYGDFNHSEVAGWLSERGFIDFAGSTVVHSVGGFVALAGAIIVGPRLGKYSVDGVARAIPGHNLPLTALGVFILWFAWFGFNCGSTNVPDGTLGFIAANTNLAACAGFLGAMLTSWIIFGKSDPSMSFNGVLAGLVGITAGCYDVSPFGAVAIGFISGVVVVLSVIFIDQKLKIDDPVGAVSVHGVCGLLGTILVGFFASPLYGSPASGLFYGGGTSQLLVQIYGALAIDIWAFVMGLVVFGLVKVLVGVRVDPKEELKGLDLVEHRTEGYSGFQFFSSF
ncbi:MAG: ammonium transporter [Deltaproteobacteria bacterium]|jgi:Amt family ammonium transporter|nr:ammonium transporter [Deltaproteobacteria bacterium]